MEAAGRRGSRAWWYAGILLVAVAFAFFAARGCAFMPWNRDADDVTARVTVTRDFGSELLKDVEVKVRRGSSALQALRETAEVETSYGGGFIYAVDGLASGYGGGGSSKADWFYYLNGQMADVGAAELAVGEGDWLLFDYHIWEYSTFTPAFAGCFPEPFVHGYREPPRECLVVCAPGWEEHGERLAELLREAGAPSCAVRELDPGWRPREGEYAIAVGTAAELAGNEFLADANADAGRIGLTAYIDGVDILLVDERGDTRGRLPGGEGLVEAIGPRLGQEGSVLMVTGTDNGGVKAALELLAAWDNGVSGPVMVMIAGAGEGGAWSME